MSRTLLVSLGAAALILPVAAQAHTARAELRHDVRSIHEERHELNRAKRHHNQHQVREERRELKQARRELHEDARDYRRTH